MSTIRDTAAPTPLSWREKNLWGMVVSTAVIYSWYFWRVFSIGSGRPWHVGGLFIEAVAFLIALQIIGAIVAAIGSRPEKRDERDRLVTLRATRNAHTVLMVSMIMPFGVALMSLGAFWIVQALLLGLVFAELANRGSQIFFYRAGV